MSGAGNCYVCGSAELAEGADPRNPTCAAHVAARSHVVSRTIGPDGSRVATCRCGWRASRPRSGNYVSLDLLTKAHWRSACGGAA